MLEIESLVKDYKTVRAVDHLSFHVSAGEIVGLLGPNGAGKTTVLRSIAGVLRPSYGSIRIGGFDLAKQPFEAKSGVAFVPEVPSLYELLTVDEHMKFVALCYDTLPIYERMRDELLRRYQLTDKANELVATLSKGMRQKLSVACALVHNAKLFLFDEPLIGIDPEGAREAKDELLREKANGAGILISTHLLDTAERLCDRVVIMQRGRKVAEGTLNQLQQLGGTQGETLEQAFLRLTHTE